MKLIPSSGAVLFVIFVGVVFIQPTQAFFDEVRSFTCAIAAGTFKSISCANDFDKSVKPFMDSDGRLPAPVYCCAVTTLRYCITDDIKEKCGSSSESMVKSAIRGIVQTVKSASGDLACEGEEFYYRKESPICWPVWGHAVGAGLLGLLILTICCVCCKACSGKSRKTNRPVVVNLLPTTHPIGNPPVYSRLSKE